MNVSILILMLSNKGLLNGLQDFLFHIILIDNRWSYAYWALGNLHLKVSQGCDCMNFLIKICKKLDKVLSIITGSTISSETLYFVDCESAD